MHVYQGLDPDLCNRLRDALRRNAQGWGGVSISIRTDPVDTTFVGTIEREDDEEVIAAIRSQPIHY